MSEYGLEPQIYKLQSIRLPLDVDTADWLTDVRDFCVAEQAHRIAAYQPIAPLLHVISKPALEATVRMTAGEVTTLETKLQSTPATALTDVDSKLFDFKSSSGSGGFLGLVLKPTGPIRNVREDAINALRPLGLPKEEYSTAYQLVLGFAGITLKPRVRGALIAAAITKEVGKPTSNFRIAELITDPSKGKDTKVTSE